MDLPERAPVKVHSDVRVKAPPELVWEALTDLDAWPEWSPGVKSVHRDGPLEVGRAFTWKAGPSTVASVLEALEPGHLIGWRAKMGGVRTVSIWRVEPDADGQRTHVRAEESWDGFLPKLMRRKSRKMANRAITGAVRALKQRAEALAR